MVLLLLLEGGRTFSFPLEPTAFARVGQEKIGVPRGLAGLRQGGMPVISNRRSNCYRFPCTSTNQTDWSNPLKSELAACHPCHHGP